jgi:hypothetical protein
MNERIMRGLALCVARSLVGSTARALAILHRDASDAASLA